MAEMVRRALNGCNNPVSLKRIPVYHLWGSGPSRDTLGAKLDKREWIAFHADLMAEEVEGMMVDWELFEKGWLVERYENTHLYYYLTQIGDHGLRRPPAMEYLH